MKLCRNCSSFRDLVILVKSMRVSLCQATVATLFMVAAATILYSEHLWLKNRRSLEEQRAEAAASQAVENMDIPEPKPCDCTQAVKAAAKGASKTKKINIKDVVPLSDFNPKDKRQIIMLSYARSGSSFTADIVIQDPRTFFTFEPLYKVLMRYTGNDQLQSFDVLSSNKFAPTPNDKGQMVSPEPYAILGNPTYDNFTQEATQTVRYFLNCQFEYLKMDDLLNFMFLNRNNTIEFYKCVRSFPQNEAYFPRYLGCVWQLKQLCLSKDIMVTKLIRFSAKLLRPLLDEYPNLKVLYVVRDPRGTLSSEMAILKSYEKTSVKEAAEQFCDMVNDDAENIRLLSEVYPGRIKTIRYETIARDAVSAAKRMYEFLQLSFTPAIEGYIRHITAAKNDGHNFSTLRKDSWLAANKWRTVITYKNVRSVDSACVDVYEAVGFVKVPRESYLRDINTSLASRQSRMENV